MATGTTYDHLRKRNQIVEAALRRVGAIKPGEVADNNMMRDAIRDLNDILREEDQDLSGEKAALWAMSSRHLFLEEAHRIYTTHATSHDGVPVALLELLNVQYRDSNGTDRPIGIVSPTQWQQLAQKDETGDPQLVFLEQNIVLASQKLWVWPIPSDDDLSAGDVSGDLDTVVGTDSLNYDCILGHTSSTENKPITGASWPMFWQLSSTTGAVWAAATEYESSKSLLLHYKRPLYDFDGPQNDPDMPAGWSSYLMWRLCISLASGEAYKVGDPTFQRFQNQLAMAEKKLFPTKRVNTTDYHNKARYF